MNTTPIANRKSIVLVGNRNAGKSTLFNRLIGYESSIVSDIAGTTTDPVHKAIELIGYGPVKISDTAGIDDIGELGAYRVRKSEEEIRDADIILSVFTVDEILDDIGNIDSNNSITPYFIEILSKKMEDINNKYPRPKKIFIVNKMDRLDCINTDEVDSIKKSNPNVHFISNKADNVDNLDKRLNFIWFNTLIEDIIDKLNDGEVEKSLIDGLLSSGDTALLVVPIDSEAPKGRLILPQVQMIRACLDEGIKVITCRDTELKETLDEIKKIDLVITDSKVFKSVGEIVPNDIRITSFSILFAREKGDIDVFLEGAKKIRELKDGDRVLIAESCVHTVSHEDIGQVVIPNLIRKKTNKNIEFEFSYGKSLPEDLSKFSLIIQCGGCMMTRNNMMSRITIANMNNIPITNYGITLAYLNGVFDRAVYK